MTEIITGEEVWDLGEEDIVTPSQKSLGKILNALILCRGKLHSSHSSERKGGTWKYPTRSCAVCFRISLPQGMRERFEELAGFQLSAPPVVFTQQRKGKQCLRRPTSGR